MRRDPRLWTGRYQACVLGVLVVLVSRSEQHPSRGQATQLVSGSARRALPPSAVGQRALVVGHAAVDQIAASARTERCQSGTRAACPTRPARQPVCVVASRGLQGHHGR